MNPNVVAGAALVIVIVVPVIQFILGFLRGMGWRQGPRG